MGNEDIKRIGTVYHIGSSLKDLGKKLFAFSKMEIEETELLKAV